MRSTTPDKAKEVPLLVRRSRELSADQGIPVSSIPPLA